MLSQFIIHSPSTAFVSPITMGHNNFLEPMLILTIKVNVGHIIIQPTLNFL